MKSWKSIKSVCRTTAELQNRTVDLLPSIKESKPHLRISFVAELPRLSEGGKCSEVKGLMLADELTLHLPWGTNCIGAPLESDCTTCCLWEQLWRTTSYRMVACKQYGGLMLSRGWEREREIKRKTKDFQFWKWRQHSIRISMLNYQEGVNAFI